MIVDVLCDTGKPPCPDVFFCDLLFTDSQMCIRDRILVVEFTDMETQALDKFVLVPNESSDFNRMKLDENRCPVAVGVLWIR